MPVVGVGVFSCDTCEGGDTRVVVVSGLSASGGDWVEPVTCEGGDRLVVWVSGLSASGGDWVEPNSCEGVGCEAGGGGGLCE